MLSPGGEQESLQLAGSEWPEVKGRAGDFMSWRP